MKLFSISILFSALADLSINLASGWLGILLISPGLFGGISIEKYLWLLIFNLPPAIISFIVGLFFLERKEKL